MAHQGICKDDENISWNKLLDYRTNFEENMSLIQTSVAIANVNAKKYRCELPYASAKFIFLLNSNTDVTELELTRPFVLWNIINMYRKYIDQFVKKCVSSSLKHSVYEN